MWLDYLTQLLGAKLSYFEALVLYLCYKMKNWNKFFGPAWTPLKLSGLQNLIKIQLFDVVHFAALHSRWWGFYVVGPCFNKVKMARNWENLQKSTIMVKSWDKCLKTSEIEYFFYEMLTLNNFLSTLFLKPNWCMGNSV